MRAAEPQASPDASVPVDVRDLHVSLGSVPVLRGVHLRVPAGQVVALIGPNGSGKTTLLRCLLGLQNFSAGEVRLFGQSSFAAVAARVGYVPQRLELERSVVLSVREFLSLRLRATRHWFWQSHRHIDGLLRAALAEVGAGRLFERPVTALSGGQLQRVLIAFSLLHRPELLLLDEPTAGVDLPGEQSFYDLIAVLQQKHRLTVVLVSHDLSMVYRHADWVYALNGVICCEGPPEKVMNADSLKEAYGIHVTPYHHHHPHVH
jgi:ABC-type Mn2+/Zn2+ transport system ATPase subunit